MKRGSYRIHPARLELGRLGYSVTEVARLAGLSTSAVSLQLAGHTRVSEPVRRVLLEELGPESAAEVLAAIPSREELAA